MIRFQNAAYFGGAYCFSFANEKASRRLGGAGLLQAWIWQLGASGFGCGARCGKAAHLQPIPEDGPDLALETCALRTGEREPTLREKPANLGEPGPPLAPRLSEL